MYLRTCAQIKAIGASVIVSIVLSACGGGSATDAIPDSGVQATIKSQVSLSSELAGAESSVAVQVESSSVSSLAPAQKSSTVSSAQPVGVGASSVAANSSEAFSSAAAVSSSPVVVVVASSTAKVPVSSLAVQSSTAVSSKPASSIPASSKAPSSIPISSKAASSTAAVSSKAASSTPTSSKVPSSIPISSKAASSIALSSAAMSSKAASSLPAAKGTAGATIEWVQPQARENGAYLELAEIGGYQIRYKAATATNFNYITLEGNTTTSYVFNQSIIGLKFEIAVYDSNGLYSDFVTIQ